MLGLRAFPPASPQRVPAPPHLRAPRPGSPRPAQGAASPGPRGSSAGAPAPPRPAEAPGRQEVESPGRCAAIGARGGPPTACEPIRARPAPPAAHRRGPREPAGRQLRVSQARPPRAPGLLRAGRALLPTLAVLLRADPAPAMASPAAAGQVVIVGR